MCSAACVLSLFLLHHVYTSLSRKLVQIFFGAEGKVGFMNDIFFKNRPCRMLLKLLTGLREVFGRPLLHGRIIPPPSWTKLILRKLYSEKESAAGHLIKFNFFLHACPSFIYYHGEQRQTWALQWDRAVFHRTESMPPVTYFPSTCFMVGALPLFAISFTLGSEVSMSSNRPSQMC